MSHSSDGKVSSRRNTFWKAKDSAVIAQLVQSLVNSRKPNGWPYSTEFQIQSMALCSLLTFPLPVQQPWMVVGRVLNALYTDKTTSLDAFERAIVERLTELRRGFHEQHSACCFILPTKLPTTLSQQTPLCVSLFGHSFGFMQIDDLLGYLGDRANALRAFDRYWLGGKHVATVIVAHGHGSPPGFVWQTIAPAFDVLRGVIEWGLHVGSTRFGGDCQRGSVPHPRVALCVREDQPPQALRFTEVPDWEVEQSESPDLGRPGFLEAVVEFGQLFPKTPEPGSIDHLIGDLLRLYGQSLEQRYIHGAALGFWQMAEVLTLHPDDRGAGDRVITRLAWLERFIVHEPTRASTIVLRSMMKKRNAAVHQGLHFQWTEEDVNLLKCYCEAGLSWLINARSYLKTPSHLRVWWEHIDLKPNDLEIHASIISHLRTFAPSNSVSAPAPTTDPNPLVS